MTTTLAEEIGSIIGAKPESRVVQRLVALVEREKAIARQAHETFENYLEMRGAS